MNRKNSGFLVETKSGEMGRTYHSKGHIDGKIPVYLCTEYGTAKDDPDFKYPVKFSETGTLCDPATLKKVGFID